MKKTIYFISSNLGKIKEVQGVLKKFHIKVIGKRLSIPEINSEVQEKVAREKVKTAANLIKKPVITEDTGAYFMAYENFPGTHPKFIYRTIGFDGILKILKNKTRKAIFKTVVGYCKPSKKPVIFTGICKGVITTNVRGKIDPILPYDSIFIPEGENRTFSEMTKEEKAKYSHRAKAIEKFARWFIKQQ